MLPKQKTKLINSLGKFLTSEQILDSDLDLKLYDTDATSLFKKKPGLVVIPKTVEEVSKIVKLINQLNQESIPEEIKYKDKSPAASKISFVARGAGTGLSGGAIGDENMVVISMAAFTEILKIDTERQFALVEAGVVNSTLSERAQDSCLRDNATPLHFAPDPSSQVAATIGGNIAENAGGIHCFKYGVTSDHVLAIEVVLPDGRVTWLRERLSKLFIGSEGMFGIVTKAIVKLTPLPETFLTMQISFASVQEAAKLVTDIVREGLEPAAIEMMDTLTISAVNKAFNLGFTDDINAVLLVELDGEEKQVLEEAEKLHALVKNYSVLRLEETSNPIERDRLWKVRKGAVAAFGQIAPSWYLYDAVVPRSKIPEALEKISEVAKKYELPLANVFHAGDGNLHPNFLYDVDKDPGVVERIHKASKEIMKLCIDLGGVLSGEHGIGVEKQEYMEYMFSEDDMETMLAVRKVFDPENISNPGKVFPLRICGEASINRKQNQELLGV